MPLFGPFYNTAPPTPSTKNNINDIAVTYGIRDYLLNKNLLPTYPFISTNINGSPRIGEPVLNTSINNNSNVTPNGLPLEIAGLVEYANAISSNQFKDQDPAAPYLLNVDNVSVTQGIFGGVDFPQGIQSYPTTATQDVSTYGLLGKTDYAKFRKKATLYNLYLDVQEQNDVSGLIDLQPIGYSQQINGYLDTYGNLNLGGSTGIQALNILGSILEGGTGLSNGVLNNNFDIRASLIGRVLGGTNIINDTKLGIIGAQQLALSLANNAAFNTEQTIISNLNIEDNILSLIKGGPLPGFRPDYKITIQNNAVSDYSSRILGYTIPKSHLSDAGSIFSSENSSGNIERANSMIINTGKGQIVSLGININSNIHGTGQFDNPLYTEFRSGYAPGFKRNGNYITDTNLYAFYTSDGKSIKNFIAQPNNTSDLIQDISYNRSNLITDYGFKTPEDTFSGPNGNVGYDNRKVSRVGFTWVGVDGTVNAVSNDNAQLPLNEKKSLLTKTQKLFNSKGMLNIITRKGNMGISSNQIETANGGGLSKGSGVLSSNVYTNYQVSSNFDNPENTYCRSWTTLDRYDKVNKLIRHSGLKSPVSFRFNTENSTLDEYGFPKIAPYITDINPGEENGSVPDIKKYMFSIENLAWFDKWEDLPPIERGLGDLTTGKKGRIMWFPPYNISFNETSSVDWEATKFIGRGEPIYTYNNTERSGTLSFSIIVDHSSYLNSFRGSNGPDDNYVASFIAGCVDADNKLSDKLTLSEQSSIIQTVQQVTQIVTLDTGEKTPEDLVIYFPNDIASVDEIINTGYENGLQNTPAQKGGISTVGVSPIDYSTNQNGSGFGIGYLQGEYTPKKDSNGNPISPIQYSDYNDKFNYGLNNGLNHSSSVETNLVINGTSYNNLNDYMVALNLFLKDKCPSCIAKVAGTASVQGVSSSNIKLSEARVDSIIDFLKIYLPDIDETRIQKNSTPLDSSSGCIQFGDPDQLACKKDRRAAVQFEIDTTKQQTENAQPKTYTVNTTQNVNTQITNRLYNEGVYFEQLKETDNFVFDNFRDKIRYFHPAFHSITPEGLNSRLTFLQQCTRQGPTIGDSNNNVGINNLAFGRPPVCILRIGDFYNTKIIIDNISIEYEPLVWDLNPEGIGVQPMIANVTLSFKFIGGSSLMGPINKLQNALSFNYYANSRVYDPRADYIDKSNSLSGYAIIDGTKSVSAYTNSITTQSTLKSQSIELQNQDAINSTNASQPQVNPNNTLETDIDKIDLNSAILSDDSTSLDIDFSVNNGPLNETQIATIILTDNKPNGLNIELGKITLDVSTSSLTQPFSLTNTPSGDITNNLVNGATYFILAKFDIFPKITTFTYTIN